MCRGKGEGGVCVCGEGKVREVCVWRGKGEGGVGVCGEGEVREVWVCVERER